MTGEKAAAVLLAILSYVFNSEAHLKSPLCDEARQCRFVEFWTKRSTRLIHAL